jgi:hypothetical protein
MARIILKKSAGGHDEQTERMLALIGNLPLTDWQQDFVRDRWWDQITWMDATARHCQRWHRTLRLVVIVCGVLAPALVSGTLGVSTTSDSDLASLSSILRYGAIVAGLLVAISTATEELFRFGQRWRHYRQTSEHVRSDGWMFFTLSGPYEQYATHADAFRPFARNIEAAFQQDVDAFITNIFRENDRGRDDKPGAAPRPEQAH